MEKEENFGAGSARLAAPQETFSLDRALDLGVAPFLSLHDASKLPLVCKSWGHIIYRNLPGHRATLKNQGLPYTKENLVRILTPQGKWYMPSGISDSQKLKQYLEAPRLRLGIDGMKKDVAELVKRGREGCYHSRNQYIHSHRALTDEQKAKFPTLEECIEWGWEFVWSRGQYPKLKPTLSKLIAITLRHKENPVLVRECLELMPDQNQKLVFLHYLERFGANELR